MKWVWLRKPSYLVCQKTWVLRGQNIYQRKGKNSCSEGILAILIFEHHRKIKLFQINWVSIWTSPTVFLFFWDNRSSEFILFQFMKKSNDCVRTILGQNLRWLYHVHNWTRVHASNRNTLSCKLPFPIWSRAKIM